MNYLDAIEAYKPINEQEIKEKKVILDYIKHFGDNVLLRDNEIAHITSSGFIMNPSLTKVLLIHHNIRDVWAWTGGHADGDKDLLYVALKEAREETGVTDITCLTEDIASIDILTVDGHIKNGSYVNVHLHLSAAYILIADEKSPLKICPNENSGVEWFPVEKFTTEYFSEHDVYLYNKLISFAQKIGRTPL
ncbi:NUDIX hydrolase [Konateibacter massiliensis]|uniref:NUDIX hydrolase n=1 Tax=Konateibacter massiliensis TaxID=2002841 RepID=UPI000C160CCE|nr:NUDIX hydrolase [Konateibacter massiliensis]